MSPLELALADVDVIEPAVPFSVRLAERRGTVAVPTRAERRAHLRHSARDLEWLQQVRLTSGGDVTLIDLSEGGALLEVDSPLRLGTTLTLELSGPGIDIAVPLEVLRCYVSSLRGSIAIYRGACEFDHLIDLPDNIRREVRPKAFVGADAAIRYLLEHSSSATRDAGPGEMLERQELLHVLRSLHSRLATDNVDLISRFAARLLGAMLPAMQRGAPRD